MSVRIITGDALTELAKLPAESVHACVTSPPYFGLRDYGTASWDGGDPGCEHTGVARRCDTAGRTDKQSTQKGSSSDRVSRTCLHCGARRIDQQIGLEATPDEYVAAMVGVFREVRRVLRSDGTLWLNIGDSYAAVNRGEYARPRSETLFGIQAGNPHSDIPTRSEVIAGQKRSGIKPKDLIGVPWMLAFALRADGWWLRSEIIWHKANPMPESVTDRPTKAHEQLFLLSKSATYFYDAAAIAEPAEMKPQRRGLIAGKGNPSRALGDNGNPSVRSVRDGPGVDGDGSRNKRSVWTIATAPYAEAHFATFPPALVEPCILAGCPAGGTVLDPFLGAGTTALVADRLGRNAIGIELNPTYSALARRRIADDAGLFFEAAE